MQNDLRVRGGTILNKVSHHGLAAAIGGLLVATPCAVLAGSMEGTAAGLFMAVVGLAVGGPLGAMIADDADEAATPA